MNLPPELNRNILQHLSRDFSSLVSCAQVSQSFYDECVLLLYNNLTIHHYAATNPYIQRPERVLKRQLQLKNLVRTLRNNPRLQRHIKSITVTITTAFWYGTLEDREANTKFPAEDFVAVLSYATNLTSLAIGKCGDSNFWPDWVVYDSKIAAAVAGACQSPSLQHLRLFNILLPYEFWVFNASLKKVSLVNYFDADRPGGDDDSGAPSMPERTYAPVEDIKFTGHRCMHSVLDLQEKHPQLFDHVKQGEFQYSYGGNVTLDQFISSFASTSLSQNLTVLMLHTNRPRPDPFAEWALTTQVLFPSLETLGLFVVALTEGDFRRLEDACHAFLQSDKLVRLYIQISSSCVVIESDKFAEWIGALDVSLSSRIARRKSVEVVSLTISRNWCFLGANMCDHGRALVDNKHTVAPLLTDLKDPPIQFSLILQGDGKGTGGILLM